MKSRLIHTGLLVVVALMANALTFQMAVDADWLSRYFAHGQYGHTLMKAFLWVVDGWALTTVAWMWISRRSWGELWRQSAGYNLLTFLAVVMAMLTLNPMYAGRLQGLRLALPLLALGLLGRSFWLGVVRAKGAPAWVRNLATMGFMLMASLLVLEGVFLFVARSHGYDGTLASKVWFARHWKLNSQGLRDVEQHHPRPERKKLFLMGDSFVAGHGIPDTSKRFSNLLQKLEPDYEIYNMGVNGYGPKDELELLRTAPVKPDQVVLFWYLNDIEECAWSHGLFAGDGKDHSPSGLSLIGGSYLVNYLWWSFPHPQEGLDYLEFLRKAFADKEILACHLAELEAMRAYCEAEKIDFSICYFPLLQAPTKSEFALHPMLDFVWEAYQKDKYILGVDFTTVFKAHSPDSLVVNAFDAHPNEFASQLVAERLHKFLHPVWE